MCVCLTDTNLAAFVAQKHEVQSDPHPVLHIWRRRRKNTTLGHAAFQMSSPFWIQMKS